MAFRGLPSQHEYWLRFCDEHRAIVEVLGSISVVFGSAERFEELLQSGVTKSRNSAADITMLTDEEWRYFNEFVEHYRRDWQTYFVETRYPVYFRELERRQPRLCDHAE